MKDLFAMAKKKSLRTKVSRQHATTWSTVQTGRGWNLRGRPKRDAISEKLARRFHYTKRRCEAPSCPGYKTYGGRGIEFRFESVQAMVDYVLQHLPHPTYNNLEVDRIDNDGHYEPGNLQLSTRRENANNRVTTFWVPVKQGRLAMQNFLRAYPECGYGRDQVRLLVLRGLTGEQIIARFKVGRWKQMGVAGRKKRGPYGPRKSMI
jgi:hypothetical protein